MNLKKASRMIGDILLQFDLAGMHDSFLKIKPASEEDLYPIAESIGKQDRFIYGRSVNHIAQGAMLICQSAFLNNGVYIYLLAQIKQGIQMKNAVGLLPVSSGVVGVRVGWIGSKQKVGAVNSEQSIPVVQRTFACTGSGKLPEQAFEGVRLDLIALLSER